MARRKGEPRYSTPEVINRAVRKRFHAHPERALFDRAKKSAKAKGLFFDLVIGDIVVPATCPVLGIPLIKNHGKVGDSSPSLDQVIPNAGYTKNNVRVISWRANKIKGNSTIDELKAIIKYMANSPANVSETVSG